MPRLRNTQFRYYLGAPITPPAGSDDAAVHDLWKSTKDALEALLEQGREIRRQKLVAAR